MLMRTDPIRELDRLTQQFFGANGNPTRLSAMPMDAYRAGDEFVVLLDLPGVDPDSIDLDVEQNVLTVKAVRPDTAEGVEYQVSERPRGEFRRQLFLGDAVDVDNIQAGYEAGVLILRIPVAEHAKPRKIAVGAAGKRPQINT